MKTILFISAVLASTVSFAAEPKLDGQKCYKSMNVQLRAYAPLKDVKAELISLTDGPVVNGKADLAFTMLNPGENGWRAKGTAHVVVSVDGNCSLESAEGQIAQ